MNSPTSTNLAVQLRDVRRTFDGGITAVDRVSLDIPEGEFIALLGPSGCGKSTLLRLIAGLDRPSAGEIQVASRREVAYVFQDPHLMPWRNVLRNVELPLELRGVGKKQRREAALAAIEKVGLSDAQRRYPAQLSGGMRMRASMARAMVTAPKLLLLDEPFAALDEITRHRLDEQLYSLWREREMTVIFVTHSVSEAAFLSQRAVVLSGRPAHILMDRASQLPVGRTGMIRTDALFSEECRALYEALERGEP